MQFLAIVMTLTGCIFLAYSLKPTRYLANKSSQSGWKLLFSLIIAFFIGYSGFAYYLIFHYHYHIIHIVFATILLLGGLFVFMVTRLSIDSYKNIISIVEETEYKSLHDSLTGLPNRKHFLKIISDHITQSRPFILFSLNLNNFKQVNDALGHYYGDKLLIEIALKIANKLNNLSVIFRTGGDEFMILLEDNENVFHSDIIDRVHSAFNETYRLMHYNIESSVSIGATKFPEDSNNLDTLLQYVDLAMYTSKTTKNRCVFYRKELNEDATEILEICGRLRKAIKAKEFDLYFQPIFISGNNKLHGAEALIRWPQKDGSFIAPDIFIPIAEKAGLIKNITKWVVQEAIINLKELEDKGFTGSLHINLSAKDLHSESLFNLLVSHIKRKTISADKLVLEITESAMMLDLASNKQMMQRLAEQGFTFSIDDFGTGFSSLSLLRELPIQQIKIDRSFVQNMDTIKTDHAIVDSAIYLANSLDCSVVAEGVENSHLEAALVKLNCHYLQGYHYCKPITLDSFISRYCNGDGK